MDTNPLTHLPGNIQIEQRISNNLFSKNKFSIMYLDLDNFKSYNDVYGFENGDMMIKAVAKCMEEACRNGEFIGHVGGDDFVIISDDYNLADVFRQIIDHFHLCLKELYSEEDYARGEIHSQNRRGEPETFPLASLSGALYTNEKISVQSINDFSYRYVSEYAKRRAQGICQLCGEPAPFDDRDGVPFLETHHIIWLADGGADSVTNTVALCPNCHRKMHILDSEEDINRLLRIASVTDWP